MAQKAALSDFYTAHAIPAMERYLNSIAAERDAALAENAALKRAKSPGVPVGTPAKGDAKPANRYGGHGINLPSMADAVGNALFD